MGNLEVTVVSGEGLIAKDKAIMSLSRESTSSDPYVVLSIGDQWAQKLQAREQTSVKSKTLTPTWNETLTTFVSCAEYKSSGDVVLRLYDSDLGVDDVMGQVAVHLWEVPLVSNREEPGKEWQMRVQPNPAKPRTKSGAENANGTLTFSAKLVRTTAAAAAEDAAKAAKAAITAAEKAEAAGDENAAELRAAAETAMANAKARQEEADAEEAAAVEAEGRKSGFFAHGLKVVTGAAANALGVAAAPEVDMKKVDAPTPSEHWYNPTRGWPARDVENGGLGDTENLQRVEVDLDKTVAADKPLLELFAQVARERIGTLRVEVLEAQGLPAMDVGLASTGTDAYSLLIFEGIAARTCTVRNSLNPKWSCDMARAFELPVTSPYSCLYVAVKDYDTAFGVDSLAEDDDVGRVVIELGALYADSEYDAWFRLKAHPSVEAKEHLGYIRLRYSLTFDDNRKRILGYFKPTFLKPHRVVFKDGRAGVRAAEFATTGGIAQDFELQTLIYYKDQLLLELSLMRAELLEVVLGVVFWRTPAKAAVALLSLASYEAIAFTGHYWIAPVALVGFTALGIVGSYSARTSAWPTWWHVLFRTKPPEATPRPKHEHGVQQRPGALALLRTAVKGTVTPLTAKTLHLTAAQRSTLAKQAVESASKSRSARWCPCLGKRGEESKRMLDGDDLEDVDSDDEDDWKLLDAKKNVEAQARREVEKATFGATLDELGKEKAKEARKTKSTGGALKVITSPVDAFLGPLLTPLLEIAIKALIVLRTIRRAFGWHDRILSLVLLVGLAGVTLVLYLVLAFFPWLHFIWLLEWLLRIVGIVAFGPHMHKVGQLLDDRNAAAKRELDLQEAAWKAPRSTFMKEFKAAYKAFYQTKLELAAGLLKKGLVPSEARTDEQKAFQDKLLQKSKPPPAERTDQEKEAEYVEYLPLATRAAAAAVAAINAKELEQAEKAAKQTSMVEQFLATVPTLDHVASPTASLLKTRFKPLLHRSQAYPLNEVQMVL